MILLELIIVVDDFCDGLFFVDLMVEI